MPIIENSAEIDTSVLMNQVERDAMIRDTHRMVGELHEAAMKAMEAIAEIQNSKGGMMGVMMKMMSGK